MSDDAARRVSAAIGGQTHGTDKKGRTVGRFVGVYAVDVLALAEAAGAKYVGELHKGAAGALQGIKEHLRADVEVWMYAHQLKELLDAAGGS